MVRKIVEVPSPKLAVCMVGFFVDFISSSELLSDDSEGGFPSGCGSPLRFCGKGFEFCMMGVGFFQHLGNYLFVGGTISPS